MISLRTETCSAGIYVDILLLLNKIKIKRKKIHFSTEDVQMSTEMIA